VRWGPTIAERTEAALHLSGAPASAALIAATIGDSCHEKSVREVLYEDPRFTRATKQTWALRQWASTSTPVSSPRSPHASTPRRRDQHQGPRRRHDSGHPDVAESSVRSYLSAPGFVIENGRVRRRTEADGWPAVPPLNTCRGAFHNGRNEIRIALPVTFDVLRGSGQTLNPAVATALGIRPGQQRSFTGR